MIAGSVWNQLVTTLENNPTLSEYVKFVFQGLRANIEPDSLPCIMLEPVSNNEVEKDFNNYQRIWFAVNIYAFSSNNVSDFNKTIVGGQDYKGILDIENDIRACLQASYELGCRAYDIKFDQTQFDMLDIGKYPVRGLVMPIKILYQQVNNV